MKTLTGKGKVSGLTLIEVPVLFGVVAILAALLLCGFKPYSYLVACNSNQKQIALGFMMWMDDHNNKYPWQVSITDGGTMEFTDRGSVSPNFNAVTKYTPEGPKLFVCPSDKVKTVAANHERLNYQNISYFVRLDAGTEHPSVNILTGDRHLQADRKPVNFGLFVYSNSLALNWTRELHSKDLEPAPVGVVSFLDGHTEVVRGANLTSVFQRQGSITNRFAIP